MSFVFRKPVPQPGSISSDFYLDKNHYELLYRRLEPDYDELLIRLSLYAFNLLSPGDQEQQVEKIRQNINVEDVEEQSDEAFRLTTFAELFKKLNFSEQRRFLFEVAKKFKRERRLGKLMSSFQQLDAEHQQQVIEKIVHVTPENLRNPGETEEELRLRRFTQLSRDYTDHVYKLVVAWKDTEEHEETSDNENGSDCFAEFFLGFSIVWFQGQSPSSQDLLIEQLSHGVASSVVTENRRLPHESEEDFKLTRFTELCKQVVDFRVQEKFLDNAEEKLETWQSHYRYRWIIEPQDSDSAAELLSNLMCFGFSLLSAMYQQRMIDEMSNQVEGVEIETSPAAAAQEDEELEGIRMARFRQLFNQVPGPKRTDIFKHFRSIFYQGHYYSQLIRFFRRLGSKDQAELIDNLFNKMTKDQSEEWDSQLIMEKFWGESEEKFRLRRFENMCIKRLRTCKHFVEDEAEERVLQLYRKSESDHNYQESSCYAEFLFDVSVNWYLARCANYRRNPVQLILFSEVELGDIIEKLAEESEEGFRLRRFTESFKQLELTSQVRIFEYIQDTLFRDLAYPVSGPQPDLVSSNSSSKSGSHSDFDELTLKPEPDHVSRNGSSNSGSHSDFDELSLKSEPDLVSRSGSSNSGSHSDFGELLRTWEPDYDELLIRLSLYAFNRLSPSDQREQVEEICRNVDVVENVQQRQRPEESDKAFRLRTFAELFNKLNFSDQNKLFLSKVVQKFKHERKLGELMSSFQQLDAKHQQQLIEKIVHVKPENLRRPEETEEDFRLRRFTQLSRDYTDHVYKLVVAWKSDQDEQEETSNNDNGSDWKSCFAEFFLSFSNVYKLVVAWKSDEDEQEETSNNDNGSDWKSCFAEFFLGFSIVWFQGQSSSGQNMLIEKLSKGVTGVMIEQSLQESEEDFKLRRFTELCQKIVDFRVQMEFLNYAEEKLRKWGCDRFSWSWILEPQEYDRAAELLSDMSTLGCSLLSAKYQRQKIEEMSNLVEGDTVTIIEESSDDDHFRMTIFTKLFNRVPVRTRIDLFKELSKMLLHKKLYSEVVPFFMGLGSEDQTEMIEKLLDKLSWEECEGGQLIIEKFSGESEADFRLRRFKRVCSKHLSIWDHIVWSESDRERVRQGTSEESSCYDSFLFDASITWFKARCANYRRNPIDVILFSQVEFRHVIEKLPEESEEEFKLRRFTESFKQLEFTSQVRFVDYIQDTLFRDLGCPVSYSEIKGPSVRYEATGPFDPQWIKIKHLDLRDQGAATSQGGGGGGGTSQGGGGGGGQGTGQP